MSYTLHSLPDAKAAAQQAGKSLSQYLHKNKSKDILLLLSGGSCMQVLPYLDIEAFSSNITLSMADDRYTDKHEGNNFYQLKQTEFFSSIASKGILCMSTESQPLETLGTFAGRIDEAFSLWKSNHKDGVIVALLGIGPDGHTAGIMPFPNEPEKFSDLFIHTSKSVIGYDAGVSQIYRYRETITLSFLLKISYCVWYACGESKEIAIKHAVNKKSHMFKTPSSILQKVPCADIYTDIRI